MPNFEKLELHPQILTVLKNKGYTNPTPIQQKAIPHILNKKDFLGIAQTGTGKTAAFSLPILQNLAASNEKVRSNSIRCLILTPTRELASQIAQNIEIYGSNFQLKHIVIFGGVSEKPQIINLRNGADIVIATPGRLLDLMSQGHVRFAQLEIFVLDEADRMLDMGFINDVKKIIDRLPKQRQTLFFSATMPEAISSLANSILTNPVKVEVTPPATTVEKIDQKVYLVAKSNKPVLLKTILKKEPSSHILVFMKTKHAANRLVDFLQQHGINAAAIHGNKSQGAREKALADFRKGECKVLIATDIAARGIDIPGITHVINFEIPIDPSSYVHRIGRTARAGRDGVAISFCDPSENSLLKSVEKTIAYKIPVDSSHPYHGVEAVAHNNPLERRDFDKNQRKPQTSRKNFTEKKSDSRVGNLGNRFSKNSSAKKFGDKRNNSRFESNLDSKPRSSGERFGDKRNDSRSESGFDSKPKSAGDRFKKFGDKRSNSRFESNSDSKPRRSNDGKKFFSKDGSYSKSKPYYGKKKESAEGLVDKSNFVEKKGFNRNKPKSHGSANQGRKFNGRNRNQKRKGF